MPNTDDFPVLDESQQAFCDKLLGLFEQQDDQGEFIFKDEDVREVLPALLMGSGLNPSDFEYGPLKALFSECREKLTLAHDADDDEYLTASRRYYRKKPPNKQLLTALQEQFN